MLVITWNMQGATGSGESKWNTDVKRLFIGGVNVACLQECGRPPVTAVGAGPPPLLGQVPVGTVTQYLSWNIGTTTRPFPIYIFWILADPGGNRNNLAIASTLRFANLIYAPPGLRGGRPAIGGRFLTGVSTTEDIFTLHAFSGSGNDAPGLLANINAVAGPWFAAGDYNCAPTDWGPPGGAAPKVYPPNTNYCPHNNVATHPSTGTNLDYAFRNPGAGVIGVVYENFVVSDHFPVAYQI